MTGIALVGSDASDLDVTDAGVIEPFLTDFGKSRYDVIYCSAGICGPRHLSVVKPSGAELAEIMLTNCFGPIRLAHRVPGRLTESGTSAFMSSHRGSTTINLERGLELCRAGTVALDIAKAPAARSLRPSLIIQGLLEFAGLVRGNGMIAAPIEDGQAGRTCTLTGPSALAREDNMRQAVAGAEMPEWLGGLSEDFAHDRRSVGHPRRAGRDRRGAIRVRRLGMGLRRCLRCLATPGLMSSRTAACPATFLWPAAAGSTSQTACRKVTDPKQASPAKHRHEAAPPTLAPCGNATCARPVIRRWAAPRSSASMQRRRPGPWRCDRRCRA